MVEEVGWCGTRRRLVANVEAKRICFVLAMVAGVAEETNGARKGCCGSWNEARGRGGTCDRARDRSRSCGLEERRLLVAARWEEVAQLRVTVGEECECK